MVTGGTGVLGKPTLRLLSIRGHEVTALARSPERAQVVRDLGATPIVGDIFDADLIREVVAETQVVMHLATAIPKKPLPRAADWEMNDRLRRDATRLLLDAVHEQKLHSFVLQSIAFVHGDTRGEWKREDDPPPRRAPREVASALEAEQLALAAYNAYGTPVVILRGAFLYAPDAYSTRALLDAVRHRRMPIIGSGEQYWHWVYAVDMARACVMAAENPAPGEIFNVADDYPFHSRDFLNYLAAELNAPAPIRLSALLARALGGSTAGFLAQSARYRTDKIRRMLGWTPQYPTYREGFAEIFRHLGKRV